MYRSQYAVRSSYVLESSQRDIETGGKFMDASAVGPARSTRMYEFRSLARVVAVRPINDPPAVHVPAAASKFERLEQPPSPSAPAGQPGSEIQSSAFNAKRKSTGKACCCC